MKKKTITTILALVVMGGILLYQKQKPTESSAISTNNVAQSNTVDSDNNLPQIKWLQRYPQLKTIPAGSMTANIDKLRTSESISALIGPIDNPYGVRNDILDAILTIVPTDNPKMLEAAIKTAYYENLADFSPSDESKLFNERRASLALNCLVLADRDKDLKNFDHVSESIGEMMSDTDERVKWGYHLDHDVFAWKTLGTVLSDSEENELCLTGDY